MQTNLKFFAFRKKINELIDLTNETPLGKSNEIIDLTTEPESNHVILKSNKLGKPRQSESIEVELPYTKEKKRECPFYKKIPGTTFTMDAFKYGNIEGCTCYFLSHYHSDHYGGLGKKFNSKLYCSEITANLVRLKIGLSSNYIIPMKFNVPIIVEGVKVTLIDGNHCPGSAIFLFEIPKSSINNSFALYKLPNKDLTILHTGDFRAHPNMLKKIPRYLDYLFLDTTYLNPKYTFPDQSSVIRKIGDIVYDAVYNLGLGSDFTRPSKKTKVIPRTQTLLDFGQKSRPVKQIPSVFNITNEDKILIAVGSYTIGKEKIATYIAELLSSKIYLNKEKTAIWKAFMSHSIDDVITDDFRSQVHVLKMNEINYNKLASYIEQSGFTKAIGIMPTGWTFGGDIWKPSTVSKSILIYSVPYSEHSSYTELQEFTSRLSISKVQPTVNMSKVKEQLEYIKNWDKKSSLWEIKDDIFDGTSIA
eukprot:NODE_374_length_9848_cov_0.468971.p2 type:complete len:475 gc:universal NODE_374_length_9848_cov_0.468971:4581-3157(-)